MPSTVLITGGNRGFGKALVETYLSIPDTTVVATVRDVAKAEPDLSSLPKASGSRIIVVHMEMASAATITAAIETLKTKHNINALDIVIANAGLIGATPSLAHASGSDIQPFIDVNAYGPFEVCKAVMPLLRAAGSKAQFVYISTLAACLNNMQNTLPISGYGASKALGNFLFKWLALDNKDVNIWSYEPGIIDTDSTQAYIEQAKAFGLDLRATINFTPASEAARTMQKNIAAATESNSGKFISHDGTEMAY